MDKLGKKKLRTSLTSDASSHDVSGIGSKPKNFCTRPVRTRAWWDVFIENVVVLEEYGMRILEYQSNYSWLKPFIQRQAKCKIISPEKQLGIILYYLSDGGRMRKTGNACI